MKESTITLIIELIRWILTFIGGIYTLIYGIVNESVFPIMIGIILTLSLFIIIKIIIDLE